MIDASHEEFDKNIAITRRVVDRAHERASPWKRSWACWAASKRTLSGHNACLTDPDQAMEFVERTGCDSLAVAIGTSHGAYKFPGKQGLHFDRIEAIRQRLPGISAGDARIFFGAEGVGGPHQRGGRQAAGHVAACPKTNTCLRRSWAYVR